VVELHHARGVQPVDQTDERQPGDEERPVIDRELDLVILRGFGEKTLRLERVRSEHHAPGDHVLGDLRVALGAGRRGRVLGLFEPHDLSVVPAAQAPAEAVSIGLDDLARRDELQLAVDYRAPARPLRFRAIWRRSPPGCHRVRGARGDLR